MIGKRLIIAIPILWGVTFLTFIMLNLLPGDAASQLLGADATPAEVRALTIKLHLNEPFLTRYWHWLSGVVQGNLGASLGNNQSVVSILGQRLPPSLELVAYAIIITLVISIPAAVIAAKRPNGIFDRFSLLVSMSGLSIAPYVLALILVYVLAVKVAAFPALGYVSLGKSLGGNLRSLTLPAFALGFPLACFYTRQLRADLLEQMQSEEYVITAQAKGLGPWTVLTRHALRNSFFGLLTVIGLNLGTLIGGTVIIEEIFSLPGIGAELITAIDDRDVPVVEGAVLVFATAVVLANLATDVLYGVLDPRIRHGRSTV